MTDTALYALFVVMVGAFSFFYGIKATKIFDVRAPDAPTSWKFHQFWLNFLGSVLGWVLFTFAAIRVFQCYGGSCTQPLNTWDAGMLLAGFIGVTGHLPIATVGLILHFSNLVEKYAKPNGK